MQLELKRIQREIGITFIFVTHDQEEALTMSDRIAVMSEGWVEQIGSPTEIYHRPATVFVAGFIGEANLLPGTARGPRTASVADGRRRRRHRSPCPTRPTPTGRRARDGPPRAGAGRPRRRPPTARPGSRPPSTRSSSEAPPCTSG